MRDIQDRLDHVSDVLDDALVEEGTEYAQPERAANEEQPVEVLAGAVEGLVQQMREEQKIVRDWAQSQADQQKEIHSVLNRLAGNVTPAGTTEPDDEPTQEKAEKTSAS